MNRTIVYTLLAFCLLGLTSAGIALFQRKGPNAIWVRDQETDTLVNGRMLLADHDYELLIPDSILPQDDDTLTWYIQKVDLTGLKFLSFQLNEPVREGSFRDTGYYDVRAYKGMKEVGASILHVVDGDRFSVQWGPELEKELGSSFSFRDASSNVEKRTWTISRAGTEETVAAGEESLFDWQPADTGTYIGRVKVEFKSGKVERGQETLAVIPAPPPPKPEPKRKDPPPVKEKPPQKWVPPPHETAALGSPNCYVTDRLEGTSFVVTIDKPSRGQVEFLDEGTSFTISPRFNCMFTGFDYFSNAQIDDIEITIECLKQDCAGKRTFPLRRKGAYDAHDAAHLEFTNTPVLNKDFQYRVTVKAKSPGRLGFFQTKGNKFTPGKEGSTVRNSDVTLTMHDLKTCIFNLKFVR